MRVVYHPPSSLFVLPSLSLGLSSSPLFFFCCCSLVTLCPYFYPLHHPLTLHPRLHPPLAPKTVQILNHEVLACLCLCVEVKKSEGSILLWKRTHFWTTIPFASPLSFFFVVPFFLSSRGPHRYKRTAFAQAPSLSPNRVVLWAN